MIIFFLAEKAKIQKPEIFRKKFLYEIKFLNILCVASHNKNICFIFQNNFCV